LALGQATLGNSQADSLKVSIDRNTKTILPGDHAKVQGYSMLSDLREIFKAKNISLTDSTWRSIRDIINTEESKDTLLNLLIDGKPIQIAINKLDKLTTQTNADNDEGWDKRQPSKKKEKVSIGRNGVHIIDGEDEVHISKDGIKIKDGGNDEVDIDFDLDKEGMDTDEQEDKPDNDKEVERFGSLGGLGVNVGLNTLNTSQVVGYNTDAFALRPFGSRFFSMGWSKNANLTVALGHWDQF
jgi:hypothetical protein